MSTRQVKHADGVPIGARGPIAALSAATAACAIVALVASTSAVAARVTTTAASVAAAPPVAQRCWAISAPLRRRNAAAERTTKRLLGDTSYTPRVKTFTPTVTSSRGFTGYQTIVLHAPRGTTPVVGYFSLRGTQPCSLVVVSAGVVLRRDAYVLELRFPGEQGNPGRVTVTLVSR
jgi:hypothetical protein